LERARLACLGVNAARMVIAAAKNPRFADRAIARQRCGEQAGQTPAAPETPVMMRTFPVRIRFMMNAVASRRSVLVKTALPFIHWDGQGALICVVHDRSGGASPNHFRASAAPA